MVKLKKENKKKEKEPVAKKEPAKAKEPTAPKEDLKAIAKRRDDLIKVIESKLLSKTQLKEGGFGIRMRHMQEAGYEKNLPEINEMGAKLGLAPIGLAHMRKN